MTRPHKGAGGSVWRLRHWMLPYRGRIAFAVASVLLSSLGAVMVPIVISRVVIDHILLGHTGSQAQDLGQIALSEWLAAQLSVPALAGAGLSYLGWMLLWVGFGHVFRTQITQAALSALSDLRRDLFAHVERLPAAFHDRHAVGQLLTRITNDVESLSQLLTSVSGLVGEIVPFAIALSVALSLDAGLTAELSPLFVLVALMAVAFRRYSGPLYRQTRKVFAKLNAHLYESLSAVETVQLFNRQARNRTFHAQLTEENRLLEGRAARGETSYYPALESVWSVSVATILWLGAGHVQSQAITLGSVVLFVQYSDMLFRPIIELGVQMDAILRARVASERIFDLLDRREALAVPAVPTPLPPSLHGQIEFRDLSFAYDGGGPVLRHVSLLVRPGESVAIVGPTGSGKTTLSRLICRFYDVPAGSVFLDGIDIMQVAPEEIRRRVGVIMQDFHLFPGTVHENIALGLPKVTREVARQAAGLVQALDFIEALPQGFDTVLNDRGAGLSQGQRQLLAFARVIALDPEILILDEATASIDQHTEASIQAALNEVIRGRTSLIIAHRLQTIRHVDRIVVLRQGAVVEQGTHAELLAQGGLYATLHAAQTEGRPLSELGLQPQADGGGKAPTRGLLE